MKLIVTLVLALAMHSALPASAVWTAVEQGLNAIQSDLIEADLKFIADDEMAGRDTPSTEQRLAARFIANRLERLDFQPGYEDGYLYPYKVPYRQIDPAGCRMVVQNGSRKEEFLLGEDYFFSSRRIQSLNVSAGVTFSTVGGEQNESMRKRWILVRGSLRSPWMIRNNALRMEAAGILIIPDETVAEDRFRADLEDSVQRAVNGRLSSAYGNDRPPMPVAYCSHSAAERLVELIPASKMAGDLPKQNIDLSLTIREIRTCVDDEATVELENVVGFWPGRDPAFQDDVIILSAHYDHVGTSSEGDIYNGADDNGSGTVGLLAVAEALKACGPLRRSVLLNWVSGEEKGLLGSRAWVENPWLPGSARPVANLNMDMIGRNAPDRLGITPTKDGPYADQYSVLVQLVEDLAGREGFTTLDNADNYYNRSDQASFARLGIPVAFLFADVHEDYHKPTDTVEKINLDKVRRVARLVFRVLHAYDTESL